MEYIIGVDIGTSSVKAIVFNFSGEIITTKIISYPTLNPEPAFFEQDPVVIFETVLNAIRLAVLEVEAGKIAGISFSSAMHSLIAVDHDGKALTNSIIWTDTRSESYAKKLKVEPGSHELYVSTGTPIHPMTPLCKLLWIKEHLPEVFLKAFKFISIKEYLFHQLFGVYVIDHSIASATGLFNIYTFHWHKAALEITNISEGHLSRPVPVTHIEKGLRRKHADHLKIGKDIPFIVGGSDGCLANLGSNAVKAGEAAVTIGTSGAIRVASGRPVPDKNERIFSYILDENHFITGGPVNNGGNILLWFIKNFIAEEADVGENAFDHVFRLAKTVAPGAEGLIFLPYLLGERAPVWNAAAKGAFFGISHRHTKAHFARAVLEGIIYNLHSIGKAVEETTGKITRIYAGGGFAQSDLWLQILSDIFNKEVHLSLSKESSALGAAIIGMEALNIIKDIEEANNFLKTKGIITANPDHHQIYREYYTIFNGLYEKLKDDMVKIHHLQQWEKDT